MNSFAREVTVPLDIPLANDYLLPSDRLNGRIKHG
ncbi:MAG: hypothetical protein ACJASX_000836 [Limisphaerales bacterium]|jgi:hypothetical protein